MDETYDSGVGKKIVKLDETHDGVLYAPAPSGRLEIVFVFVFWFVVHIETVHATGPGGGAL